MRNKIAFIPALILLCIVSCTEKKDIVDLPVADRAISFAPTLDQKITSSGYLDDNNDGAGGFAEGDVIGVFGYEKEGSSTPWENNERPDLMYNVTLTKQVFQDEANSGVSVVNYVYSPQRFWPNLPNRARFFAYYPHSSMVPTGTISPSSATYSGYPFVEVTLGLSKKPLDFVTAKTDFVDKTNGIANGVTLVFAHQLSKLMFKVKASGLDNGLTPNETRKMYINQLRIKNIYNKATFTFDDLSRGAWTNHSSQGIDASTGATIASNSVMAELTDEYRDFINPHSSTGSYLLMIPQIYDNVEFEVIYTIERLNINGGCEDRTVVTKRFPASVNWETGQVYTYYIEFGFSDIDGEKIGLDFTVAPWVEKGYGIEMGS